MTSAWISALALLLVLLLSVNAARNESDRLPCAEIRTTSPVVALGSPVTATCIISDSCPLGSGQAVHMEWQLGQHHLPSSTANNSGRISGLVIPNFNETRTYLTCCVRQASGCPIVAGVEIRAGCPPPIPQNLTCQTNLAYPTTVSCNWYPGDQETHLPTKYTLHTYISTFPDGQKNHTYELPTGVHHYTIPRSGFDLYNRIEMYVKVANYLGEASSEPIILEPLGAAKFDPPKILKAEPKLAKYGCLWLSWRLSSYKWVLPIYLNLEVRLKTAESNQWSEPIPCRRRQCEVCRLRHGTEYQTQIRVRYQQSPWSEWSSSLTGVTLEKVPTGRIDTWMRISGGLRQTHLNAHLFWKPSKQFHANGKNVSYSVLLQWPTGQKNVHVCSTSGYHCDFRVPRPPGKVFLCAKNAAGKSNLTKVPLLQQKARAALLVVTVLPHDDRSLLVQWETQASSGITDFVVEWRPLLKTDHSLTLFDIVDRNQSSLLITGSFEPYKPYGISVYPRYKDGIGLPLTVNTYSKQKAPSMVPEIRTKEVDWWSAIELTWDEIPLGQRNGIISSYRVFFWDDKEHKKVVEADLENRIVVLKELNTSSLYKAFIMVSTDGGSLNGSTITFKAPHMDAATLSIIVAVCMVGLILLIMITVMICFLNNKRLKVRFWPLIPDPANSSIRPWAPESIQDAPPLRDNQETDPVYLSHLSILEMPKQLYKGGDECWLDSGVEDTSDLGESICGSPISPEYSRSNSDSVPYATVIVSGSSQPANHLHVYLRSESTQPLLESEESSSPKSYQNMTTDEMPMDQYFFGECHDGNQTGGESVTVWDDFPLLRALVVTDTQSEL